MFYLFSCVPERIGGTVKKALKRRLAFPCEQSFHGTHHHSPALGASLECKEQFVIILFYYDCKATVHLGPRGKQKLKCRCVHVVTMAHPIVGQHAAHVRHLSLNPWDKETMPSLWGGYTTERWDLGRC